MKVLGLESVSAELKRDGFFVKAIVTEGVAIFFPGTIQHREIKAEGISYEDDHLGNALALTATKGRFDLRFHRDFSDARVESLMNRLLSSAEMAWAAGYLVFYQGRQLR